MSQMSEENIVSAKCRILDLFCDLTEFELDSIEQWICSHSYKKELETKRLMKISEKCLIEIGDTIKELVPFEAEMESEKIVPPVVGDQSDCNSVNTIHVDEFLYDQDEVHKMMKDGRLNKHFCLDCNSRNVKDLTLISHSMSRYALQYIFRVLLPADLEEKQILDIGSRLGAVLYGAYHFSNAGTIVGIEMNKECCDVQERIISQYSMDNNRIRVVNSDVMDCSDIVRNSDVIIINVLDFFVDVDKHKQMWYFFKKHIKKGSYIVCNRSMAETLGYLEIFDDLISWLSICKPSQMENEVFFDIEDCNELFLYTAN